MKRGALGVLVVLLAGVVWALRLAAADPTPPAGPAPRAVERPLVFSNEAPGTIRIAAGREAPYTDAQGHKWEADRGFDGGQTIDRSGDVKVTGTPIPELYACEHYSMDGFSIDLPNGKYVVKLHFAECYDGIQDESGRIFSFNVQGHEFKDFSVWKKAGDHFKAYVETVDGVEVKDGKLKITFTPQVENPMISGIEILPVK